MKSTKRLITELADRLSHIEKMVEVMYMMDTIQPEKPKRGRPKGSKNKTKKEDK